MHESYICRWRKLKELSNSSKHLKIQVIERLTSVIVVDLRFNSSIDSTYIVCVIIHRHNHKLPATMVSKMEKSTSNPKCSVAVKLK